LAFRPKRVVWSEPVNDWPKLAGLRIESRLLSEGVTESYDAVQEDLGRRVVVKSLKPNVLPSSPFAGALGREAQLLSELTHPNIQRLYDFRRTESQMWLVLEHLEGQPMTTVLARLTQLPPLAVASLGFMVASALTQCHQHGVVHRAIQPRNLMLKSDGRIVLLNFVGAIKDRLPTAPELLDGTNHLSLSPYFSPEQILGETVDPRSDIFSLGVVLYEALTGNSPFASPDESRVSQRIRKDVVAPASRFARDVPGALERALHRCLEKMPQDRFASAEELCHAFLSLLRDYEVVSPEAELRQATLPLFASTPNRSIAHERSSAVSVGSATRPIATGLIGLCVGSLLIGIGGFVLPRLRGAEGAVALRNTGRLEFLPERAGTLRIVADPWATVTIDGQAIGTTPMARPIPLQAGTHYVHLEHPRAPIERRTLRISAGETVLLDVKMNVAPSSEPTPAPSALGPDAGFSP
jgi:eukaryotic-like serine/threonine-protein kinase